MKRRTVLNALVVGFLLLGMFVVPAVAELQTVTLTIDGMT